MKHANIKISTFKTNGTFYDDYLSNINGYHGYNQLILLN